MNYMVTVTGIEAVIAKLGKLQAEVLVAPWIQAVGIDAQTWMAEYPPSTEANVANAMGRWYERGRGSWRTRKNGSTVNDGKSERLQANWTMTTTDGGLGALVGTSVTYARFVNDREVQAGFHARRGWRTVQRWKEQRWPEMRRWLTEQIDKVIGG